MSRVFLLKCPVSIHCTSLLLETCINPNTHFDHSYNTDAIFFSRSLSRWHFCCCCSRPFSYFETMSQRVWLLHNATYDSHFPLFSLVKTVKVARSVSRTGSPEAFIGWRATVGKEHVSLAPSPQPIFWVNASNPFPRARKTRAMPNNCAPRSYWNARHASGAQWHAASLWHGQIRARHCWRSRGEDWTNEGGSRVSTWIRVHTLPLQEITKWKTPTELSVERWILLHHTTYTCCLGTKFTFFFFFFKSERRCKRLWKITSIKQGSHKSYINGIQEHFGVLSFKKNK